MTCTRDKWRFGRATGLWWLLERWGAVLVLLAWLFYVFVQRDFAHYAQTGSLLLVDLLLGVPLIIALGLVVAIIWMGLIRSISCLLGKLELLEDPFASDDDIDTTTDADVR